MKKEITRAVRMNENELSMINEYKQLNNIKNDSSAIRDLIKNGLNVEGIGNKSLTTHLQEIKSDFNDLDDSVLKQHAGIDIKFINLIQEVLSNLFKINLFMSTWFHTSNKYNYTNFIQCCLEGNNDNHSADDFLTHLEEVLDYRYVRIYDQNHNCFVFETVKVYQLLKNVYQFYKHKEYFTREDAQNFVKDVQISLNQNKLLSFNEYQQEIILSEEEDHIDIHNAIQIIKSKESDISIIYQCFKDLYLMLYSSRVDVDKDTELMKLEIQ